MKAWHFLPSNGCLSGTNDQVIVGHTDEVQGEIIPERWGLHASHRALQAAFWAPSLLLTRVELGGTIVKGDRKLAASQRTVLWKGDATVPFWTWAIERAQAAIDAERALGREVEEVFLRALQARKDFVVGKISLAELLTHRGPARLRARRMAGCDTRNVRKPQFKVYPIGARTAASRCQSLVEGEHAHRHVASCPPEVENTPSRKAECDRLEELIIEHSKKGWFLMSVVVPPKNAWCIVQLADPPRTFRGQWTGGGFRGVGARPDEVVAWRLMETTT